ncbi:hypothetical protein ACQVC4_003814 [Yersinia enterocolitica]|nr:hypothetical protein [Yersinia enterocolitica]EKN3995244.1 hypothetical protein [Yersinia enterocolitica]
MSLSCSESGLPSVASIISVLQHRATDLIAFSIVDYMRSPRITNDIERCCYCVPDEIYPEPGTV